MLLTRFGCCQILEVRAAILLEACRFPHSIHLPNRNPELPVLSLEILIRSLGYPTSLIISTWATEKLDLQDYKDYRPFFNKSIVK